MEIGYSIAEPVHEVMRDWSDFRVVPDLQGIPRVVVARKPNFLKHEGHEGLTKVLKKPLKFLRASFVPFVFKDFAV